MVLQADVSEVVSSPDPQWVDSPFPPPRRSRVRFLRHVPMVVCGVWLLVVVIAAVGASWLPFVQEPNKVKPVDRLQGPSVKHWFGTDQLGRDTFARAVWGARVSMLISVCSVAIGMTIGASLGIVSGYMRGRVDGFISWITDVILSFPALVLLIAIVAFTGGGLRDITLSLAFLSIPIYARLARAHTLSIAGEDFVLAARAGGAGRVRILWREIVPNVLPTILAYALVAMSIAIVTEGTLSYLGLSVKVPQSSWGGLIASGQNFVRDTQWGVLLPSGVLCLTVLCLNVIGEKLRRRYEVGSGG